MRCDNLECELPIFRIKVGKTLTDEQIADLLTAGHTEEIQGFNSKQGHSFSTAIAFDENFDTVFVFPEKKNDRKTVKRKK